MLKPEIGRCGTTKGQPSRRTILEGCVIDVRRREKVVEGSLLLLLMC